MARQLEEINSSGELLSIKKGGAGVEKELTTKEYVDAADALKQDKTQLNADIKTYMESGSLEIIRLSQGADPPDEDELVPNVADFRRVQMMKWKSAWDINNTPYKWLDVVRDGDWTMIVSNVDGTNDRAAPQPSGNQVTEYPIAPTFAEQSFIGVVQSGHEYTFNEGGWVQKLEVYVPEVSPTTVYRFIVTNITDPNNPVVEVIEEPILVDNQWVVVALKNAIVKDGTKWRIVIDAQNTSGTTQLTGGWTYAGSLGAIGVPLTAQWTKNNGNDTIRIDKTDIDTVDRSADLLSMVAGTEIKFAQTSNPDNSFTFKTQVDPVDGGTYYEYTVLLINQIGTIPEGVPTTMTAEVPTPVATKYVDDVDFWVDNSGVYADMEGYLALDGVEQTVPGNAYGVRLTFQAAIVSPDWELVAYSGAASSASGGGSSLAYAFGKGTNITVTAVNTDQNWTPLASVSLQQAPAGIYEYKMSVTWTLASAINSGFLRFSTDGGSTWNAFQSEPKDATDKTASYYAFPIEYTQAQDLTLHIEGAKENAPDVMTVQFADAMIDQKT